MWLFGMLQFWMLPLVDYRGFMFAICEFASRGFGCEWASDVVFRVLLDSALLGFCFTEFQVRWFQVSPTSSCLHFGFPCFGFCCFDFVVYVLISDLDIPDFGGLLMTYDFCFCGLVQYSFWVFGFSVCFEFGLDLVCVG